MEAPLDFYLEAIALERKNLYIGMPSKNKLIPRIITYQPDPAAAISVYTIDSNATPAHPFALDQERLNSAAADNP
jgi:hypothetical protein